MQYIEIYNYGHTVLTDEVSLNGFATGSLPSKSLLQGGLAVLYNTENSDVAQTAIPDCTEDACGCTEGTNTGGIRWCQDAIYLGCCDDPTSTSCTNFNYGFELDTGNCQFISPASMTTFNIELVWNTITIDSVSFSNDAELTLVPSTYALELKNKGYNNDFGSSWVPSCLASGTPGDDYLSVPCYYNCRNNGTSGCNLNGGMDDTNTLDPGCSINVGQTEEKSCNCLTGYYPWYKHCLPLPSPTNCIGIELSGQASRMQFNIAKWDGDTIYAFTHCLDIFGCDEQQQPLVSSVRAVDAIIFDPGRDSNATQLALDVIGSGGNDWQSVNIECLQQTAVPTPQPTKPPTSSVPEVPSCTATLNAGILYHHNILLYIFMYFVIMIVI